MVSVRDRLRRLAYVGALLALALGLAGAAAIVRGSAPKRGVGAPSAHGRATAAPAINLRRLSRRHRARARALTGRETDALPERWQRRQEKLERLHAAGRLPTTSGRRTPRFRSERFIAPSPGLDTNFDAVDDNDLFIPPDTEGAPGPDKLLITVNGTVKIERKSDGSTVSTASLDSFFGAIPGAGIAFDPHALYDPYSSRWIVAAVSNPESPTADVLLAVSQTSDPNGSWNEYSVDVDSANSKWADYPTVGFNKSWIVVSVNMFAGRSFAGTQTYAFDKEKAYAGAGSGGGAFQRFTLGDDFALSPTATYDPNASDLYLAEDYDGTGIFSSLPLRLFKLSGPVGSASLTRLGDPSGGALSALGRWSDVSGGSAGFAPQLGSPQTIDNGDARLSQCVYRNASIWCASTVFLPSAAPTHSAVQWYKIDPAAATPTVVHAGRIDDATGAQFYAYPSIAVNKYNDALLGFSRFAADQFASADYAFRGCGDAVNTFRDEAAFRAGLGSYAKTNGGPRNRWGDYSGTWVDPTDDTSMWTIQEYAKAPVASGTWGTWWGKLAAQPQTVPAAPRPASSDHTTGVPSTNQVVHVSWAPTDDCAVSYAYKWSTSASDPPNAGTDGTLSGNVTALASPTLAAGSSWWLHLEAVDVNGTPSPVADLGPFPIGVCIVPTVRGRTLAAARTSLQAARCSTGAVTRRFSRAVAKGRVISQGSRPGTQLANGASVALVVSKGRAPFRPPVRVTLCYRHHTVHVTRAAARKLRRHGAKLGACRRAPLAKPARPRRV